MIWWKSNGESNGDSNPATYKPTTYKQRVLQFWDWFRVVAERFQQAIDQGHCRDLIDETSAHVHQMLPHVGWVYGPGSRPDHHSLTLAPEGNRSHQFLTELWWQLAPELPRWEFFPAKQPNNCLEDQEICIGGQRLSASDIMFSYAVDEQEQKLDVSAWHPVFQALDEEQCYQLLFLWLDELLGEFGTENWIGNIDVRQMRAERSGRLLQLRETVDEVCREKGWAKGPPHSLFSLYERQQPGHGFLRADSITGVSCHMELIQQYFASEGDPDDLLEGTGADFVFVHFPASFLPRGNEAAARGDLEDAFGSRLAQSHSGQLIGGAMGLQRAYVDLVIYDGEQSLNLIETTARELQLPEGTAIHHFARSRRECDRVLRS